MYGTALQHMLCAQYAQTVHEIRQRAEGEREAFLSRMDAMRITDEALRLSFREIARAHGPTLKKHMKLLRSSVRLGGLGQLCSDDFIAL